ncbi:MAG: aldo/keto reductase [Alphaproteobacteria bacterium]|nr:aldo/keto reductase [Alphaproteobacteria bacterium]
MHTVAWPDGRIVPALGQGSWKMGEDARRRQEEVRALRVGLDLGLSVIDTAEMYAEGGAEEVVAEAIAGQRDKVFLVSKVYPHNASRSRLPMALARSLKRLKTDVLDCYLLHWRGSVPLADTAEVMERMQQAGHIRSWGVSNLDLAEMQRLPGIAGRMIPGSADHAPGCATNQVLLHLGERGVEFDLAPWMAARGMPLMAYSPLGQGAILDHPTLASLATRHNCSTAAIALAWVLSRPGTMAIPKTGTPHRVGDNARALEITLDSTDLSALDTSFPPPRRKRPLAML